MIDFDNYYVIGLYDSSEPNVRYSTILLNKKNSPRRFQDAIYEGRTKHEKEIDEFGNDIETILGDEEVVVDKYTEFINKISKLLMTLDTTRVELCDLHKQMSEYQSAYDKSDQTYLHKLENIDTENFAELQRFMVEWKMSRGARRNIKDLVQLVANLLDTIPVKNYASALPVLKGSAYLKKENANDIMSTRGYANEKNRY